MALAETAKDRSEENLFLGDDIAAWYGSWAGDLLALVQSKVSLTIS
jgi:hypothetical protein